jgi:thiol-disulfide isomerase/thioredoxin
MTISEGKKPILFLLIIFLIFLLTLTGCTQQNNSINNNFTFTTLGNETKLLSDYYGTVILLDCMAVNCQPCMLQMLELKKVSENFSKNDVIVLSIDVWVSNGETATMLQDRVDAFKNQLNITLDWTFGLDDAQGSIEKTYASAGVPTLYIFDKKGNIYYSHVGYEDYSVLSSKLNQAISKG